jgi:hypothetical protein
MLLKLNDDMSPEEKLNVLLSYHKVPKHFKYQEEDIHMIIMALNQDDIIEVMIDDEGNMNIDYSGTEWQ